MKKNSKKGSLTILLCKGNKIDHMKNTFLICLLAVIVLTFVTACSNEKKDLTLNDETENIEVSAENDSDVKTEPIPSVSDELEDGLTATSSQTYDIVNVVKSVSQSVVSINVTTAKQDPSDEAEEIISSGSGIIVSEDNENIYIATNYHVIQNVDSITVGMGNSQKVTASYIGSNEQSDLAVISVTKQDFKSSGIKDYSTALFGDSDLLEVGEYVVAIGNALGEGTTVTDGIVSAKNKMIKVGGAELSILQTNAALNQGNSGGPLSNMNGEIIGINTAKLSKEGVEGMGYSIPINDAKIVIDDIMQNPGQNINAANSKPQLGIKGITITTEMMEYNNFQSLGIYVAGTLEGSDAEAAGLQRGDIIIAFESTDITTVEELGAEIEKCNNGDTVKIYIYREGSTEPERLDLTFSP